MNVLLIYGTLFGSTSDIADFLEKMLLENNYQVDVYEVKDVDDVSPLQYDMIVFGSCVIAGSWVDGIESYLFKYSNEIIGKNVAFFVSCGEALKTKRIPWIRKNYIEKKLEKYPGLMPISLGVFGGVFDFYGKHKNLENPYLNKIQKKLDEKGIDTRVPYDFRDWTSIQNWINKIVNVLKLT